jgi:CHAD domain-containing protein
MTRMKKDLFDRYIHSRLRSTRLQVGAFGKSPDPTRLHRIRVDIKKIRAVLAFVSWQNDKVQEAEWLKPLFRKAGQIRELDMHEQMLNQLPHPPKRIITRLKNQRKAQISQFKKNMPRYFGAIKKFKRVVVLDDSLPSKKNTRRYFKQLFKKACRNVQRDNPQSLHAFRKTVKKLLYVLEMLPAKYKRAAKTDQSLLELLQKQVGEWHDVMATLTFLSKQKANADIRHAIQSLKKKEAGLAGLLYRKIERICH